MTDRELLKLAAKAAKLDPLSIYANGTHLLDPDGTEWNPLTDDGDALRLAVKAGLRDYFGIEVHKTASQCTAFEPWEHCEYEEHNKDPYAATRRAIVRAAAEIGKGME